MRLTDNDNQLKPGSLWVRLFLFIESCISPIFRMRFCRVPLHWCLFFERENTAQRCDIFITQRWRSICQNGCEDGIYCRWLPSRMRAGRGEAHTHRATAEEEPLSQRGEPSGKDRKDGQTQGWQEAAGAGSSSPDRGRKPRGNAPAWGQTLEQDGGNPEGSPHRPERRLHGEECVFFVREYESPAYLLLPHVQIHSHTARYLSPVH